MSTSVTLWTIVLQAPLSMGFSRQEYWSGLPFPSPGDLPSSGIKPGSPALQADALNSEPPGIPSLVKEMPLEIKLLLQTSDAFLGLQGRLFWVTFFVFQVSNGH